LTRDGTVRLGIRPRRIRYARSENSGDSFPAEVFAFESVGEAGILTVRAGEETFKLVVPPEVAFEKDDRIRVSLPWEHVYLFSTETGKRLIT
jgi:ABC-type sugar transport system ATPase subunit